MFGQQVKRFDAEHPGNAEDSYYHQKHLKQALCVLANKQREEEEEGSGKGEREGGWEGGR